jgi:penicillin amidase
MRLIRRAVWTLLIGVSLLLIATAGAGLYLRARLVDSLPQLTGSRQLAGLEHEVQIDRDALSVPTIVAASRRDAARALGFLHAQERFFQMDLQRRQPAGELSALVGARAVDVDRAARVHRFRHVARAALQQANSSYRAILDAYAEGVNAGLAALDAAPIEYLAMRAEPEPWRAEDSILTVLAMFNTLQGRQATFEATFGTLADTLPPPMYDFLTARGSEWDAPVAGSRFPRPPIPAAGVFDARRQSPTPPAATRDRTSSLTTDCALEHAIVWPHCLTVDEAAGLGSNNWAVAGTHTQTGAALVANDMHLGITVPNIWYRASIVVRDADGSTLRLAGVTLPGLPSLVVGSNGHVAWGFTNTGGDWSDLVIVEPDARAAGHYITPAGPQRLQTFDETIAVLGGESVTTPVRWTVWGPIVRRDHRGRDLAQRWVAHDASILAGDITAPERARTVDEALAAAAGLGIPAQNFVVGDTTGRIAWTIAGPIPRRVGFDGSRPVSWADGTRKWDGYLTADAFPRIVDPAGGRIWTANAPVVDGDMLARIGEGGYADGIRARIIRDRLHAIDQATAADMLSIQLDTSALFHDRWRRVALAVLTEDVVRGDARRAEFRRLLETTWTGRADPDSIAYRLVRTFRAALSREIFTRLTTAAAAVDPDFDFTRALRSEGPLWQLITERPTHLLSARYRSWDEQLVGAIDVAIGELTERGVALASRSWGEFNRAIVTHPLGTALPLAGRWLNMPADPLPGDVYTPRAHSPRAGPSERMVVSPGREQEGILHMPTGQSGNPWSPHYRDQHGAWLSGEPLPLLPGAGVARLTLTPRAMPAVR